MSGTVISLFLFVCVLSSILRLDILFMDGVEGLVTCTTRSIIVVSYFFLVNLATDYLYHKYYKTI